MKTKGLCGTLSLLLVFFIMACSNHDKVNIDQLAGEWAVVNNDLNIPIDNPKGYLFKADNVCIMYYSRFLDTESEKDSCIYIVSKDGRFITIYNRNQYVEQWKITKLNHREMTWKSLSTFNGFSIVKLYKSAHNAWNLLKIISSCWADLI